MFSEISAVFILLCWFISTALNSMLNPVVQLAIFVPVLLGIFPFLIRNDRFRHFGKDARIKGALALMPVFWVTIGVLGAVFHYGNTQAYGRNFAGYLVCALALAFLVYGVYCLSRNKGYRIATAVLFAVNGYFTLFIGYFAFMTITTGW